VGVERRPKSTSGVPGSESANEQGAKAVERFGCGDYDEKSGLYEWYEDLPLEVLRPSKPIKYGDIFAQWSLVEADFHEFYNVDLEDVFWVKSWRWFTVRVDGLLGCDSRLQRHFREDPEPVEVTPDE
jgi:hypothetical protein